MEEQHQQPSGAKNFFFYFLSFALLYTVAFNFGGVLFDFIHKAFPLAADAASGARFSNGALRIHLASLIIGTPIFLWLSRMIYRRAQQDMATKNSGIRRWLTYITLILTALIAIGDLIALVNNLLGGDTSLRFLLKAAVVLIIAGSIFYYYITDIKSTAEKVNPLPKLYFSATAILVLASVITGFFFIESPAVQRQRQEDQARLNSLFAIDQSIKSYAAVNGKAPQSLADIQTQEGGTMDPVTNEPFEYNVLNGDKYELCATFATSNRNPDKEDVMYIGPDMWLHDAGHTCFQRTTALTMEKMAPVPVSETPPVRK